MWNFKKGLSNLVSKNPMHHTNSSRVDELYFGRFNKFFYQLDLNIIPAKDSFSKKKFIICLNFSVN